MDAPKTKIAIISQSLGGGGAERFAGHLSFLLTDSGFEVHNIILNEPLDYAYEGEMLNLGAEYKGKPQWRRKIGKMAALKNYLHKQHIDIIIDNRTRSGFFRELATQWVYGNRKIHYMIHNYKLDNYLPKNATLAKWMYRKARSLICVSKAIEEKVIQNYGFKNTITIYNPINLPSKTEDSIGVREKYILYFGRFDDKAKNFKLMLEGFALSEIYKKGYSLVLMGEGPDRDLINHEISKRNLGEYAQIIPYQKNPFSVVEHARYTILTSHFEGFPMSVIESLAMGTPLLAVDCNSGPREIITDEKNGLLVENYNAAELAKAMSRLVDDEILYSQCKANTKQSVAHLAPDVIATQWKNVLTAI
jgi:glycosyltransferase involved in cell wall biosynthesis